MEISFKGFHEGLICMNKHYVPYEWNEEDKATVYGNAHCGMFSAPNPLDVFSYYSGFEQNEFWLCLIDGDLDEDGVGSRVATTRLKPVKRLNKLEYAIQSGKYLMEHPWVEHNMVFRDAFYPTYHFSEFVLVRGKAPKARADKGTIVVLLKEAEDSNKIISMSAYEVDGEKYEPDLTYTI